jgi:hypothetical protein
MKKLIIIIAVVAVAAAELARLPVLLNRRENEKYSSDGGNGYGGY